MRLIDCPACGATLPAPFFIVGRTPVHSTLLMRTRQQALEYPGRPLKLAMCDRCGFITNRDFDPGLHEYSPECEEGQGASPTFREWMRSLAGLLIDRYDIRQRLVLEIGCGKGDFLSELCLMGDNRGLGYDPAYVPGRMLHSLDRLAFEQRKWTGEQGTQGADVIVCRHTLEHIPDVRDFMLQVRDAIGDSQGDRQSDRQDTLLFFEVPDTRRVLEEGAFWDIYYEHCSYFDRDSLCHLFRHTGFEILDCWRDFDDQYLLLVAKAGSRVTGPEAPKPAETPVRNRLHTNSDRWQDWFDRCRIANQSVMIWGGGSKAVAFLNGLDCRGVVEKVIDINPFKHGCFLPGSGHEVVSPGDMTKQSPDFIVLMNPVYRTEVQSMIDELGIRAILLDVTADPTHFRTV